ncbi:hypothetical protein G7B40_024795 [Aetokthonos hydrillicola Thurmond2011]|jgi:hypothetical protein|uniref:Uncharacterized protein n=1 Tax=Aetokthonos hydrillicola Thurmond2011 TaxID=2712845 RepID=A0AAP5IA74_9CYAN|nr:hypothetical protein [Aetokthonos hydrillicola]MBW4586153.1 hypothetical protein [Aetokthonos hydrillicola CCALA 1050]MDR9897760.1 hypothetical protein [Aetokthonos hydrillicola Thurmond2011]
MTHTFKRTISITLAVVLCCSTIKPTIAQPVPVLALPLVSTPAGLIFVGIVTVAGVTWYVYENSHHHKYRSRIAPNGTVHSESNEQHQEKLITTTVGGKTCSELAEEETKKTGRKWYVKDRQWIRFTGPIYQPPGNPVRIECTLTTNPDEAKDTKL